MKQNTKKPDPKVASAEKALDKAVKAAEAAKAAIVDATVAHKHPRQLNKARTAVHDSIMDMGRSKRWIERFNKG